MATVRMADLIRYIDGLINTPPKQDYCVNGLQVEGRPEVARLVSGVSVCQELVDAASEAGADLLLVHHGLFWKGDEGRIVGMKRHRLRALLNAEINLLAYHLPLDTHPELGNNALLLKSLRAEPTGTLPGEPLVLTGRFSAPLSPSQLEKRLAETLNREPQHLPGGPEAIQAIAVCSGGAASVFEAVAQQGFHAFVTGESAEKVFHMAREYGTHYYAAGHHATETFGVRALGEHLAQKFGLEHTFIEVPNPL